MKNLFVLFSFSLLVGCAQPAKKPVDSYIPKPTFYTTPKGDKIVFLDDYYRAFLMGIKAGNKNYDSLYKSDIGSPIQSYFAKSEYADLVGFQFNYGIRDTTGLKFYISSIKKNEGKIDSLITSALADANKYLKNDSITVYVQPSHSSLGTMINKMGGILAVTAGSKQILITIDTGVKTWQEMLKYTIVHEFNHTYWTKMKYNKSDRSTLLDYLVFEGRADAYADMIYPDNKCPWTMALSEQEKIDLWKRIQPNLNSEDEALQRGIMFGSDTYPLWGGYTMGYNIVQSALRNHPDLKPIEWATMEPYKILALSNYNQ